MLFVFACAPTTQEQANASPGNPSVFSLSKTSLVLLGTVQDGGFPHIACAKDCRRSAFNNPEEKRQVISLGLVDVECYLVFFQKLKSPKANSRFHC